MPYLKVDKNRNNINLVEKLPDPHLEDLPSDLRPLVRMMENKLDESDYKKLLTDMLVTHYGNLALSDRDAYIADIASTKNGASRRRKSVYAGALAGYDSTFDVGAYNPDKISYSTYDKMEMDAQIGLALELIKTPIEHVNFSIEASSDEVEAVVSYILNKIYVRLVRDLLMGLNYGHSFLEKTWRKIKNVKLSKQIRNDIGKVEQETVYNGPLLMLHPKSIHPSSYTIILDKYGEMKYLKQRVMGSFEETKINSNKLIKFIHKFRYGNWYGISRMKAAYKWWYWGEIIFQFMIRYLERKASPALVVKAPHGFSTDSNGQRVHNFSLALKLGNQMVNNAVGVLPAVYDSNGKQLWDMNYLQDDQRVFMFLEVLNFVNIMKSRAMHVPDSVATQNTQHGSFSTSDAHTDVHLMMEEALLHEIEDVINNQIIPDIIKYHFVDAENITCRINIEKLTLTRKQLLKEIFNKMLGVSNQFVRDGGLPLALPDISKMGEILDIPMASVVDVFNLESWIPGMTPVSEDDDITKEEKIKDNNRRPGADNRDRSRIERRKKLT